MRAALDTSIWIQYLRGGKGLIADGVDELLEPDAVVLLWTLDRDFEPLYTQTNLRRYNFSMEL